MNSIYREKEPHPLAKLMLSLPEAAEQAGVTVKTLYSWEKGKGFPITRIGGRSLVSLKRLEAWLDVQGGSEVTS